jgi:hypothetical protein
MKTFQRLDSQVCLYLVQHNHTTDLNKKHHKYLSTPCTGIRPVTIIIQESINILTCSVFTVLWGVKRWLCKQEIVILWLCTKILKDTLLKKPFHEVPVFNQTMSYRILENKF